ncbi:sigma factor-like helix-turn-helix DNA-binding protein [Streptomyces sp. NPDC057411]|uniref:sigma-70 region 4 domain-containing protein n=1 Tax=unclassified Streptomyces TaxID=2593676 RepID=UPI0036445AB1
MTVRSGLDYAAAAKALDIPVGIVRSRLSRARKKLHKYAQASPVAGAGAAVEDGNPDPGPRHHRQGRRHPAPQGLTDPPCSTAAVVGRRGRPRAGGSGDARPRDPGGFSHRADTANRSRALRPRVRRPRRRRPNPVPAAIRRDRRAAGSHNHRSAVTQRSHSHRRPIELRDAAMA